MRLDEEVLMDFFREYISVSVSPTTFFLNSYYYLRYIFNWGNFETHVPIALLLFFGEGGK